MRRKNGQDKEMLDAIAIDIHRVFGVYNANNLDMIDVLAKFAGYALAVSVPPNHEMALAEFARMVRHYRDDFILFHTPAYGTG